MSVAIVICLWCERATRSHEFMCNWATTACINVKYDRHTSGIFLCGL